MIIASMQSVVKSYGQNIVLDHVDLDINEGEIIGLLGPNGDGKTTLIQTLTGMIAYEKGKVELYGNNVGFCSYNVFGVRKWQE